MANSRSRAMEVANRIVRWAGKYDHPRDYAPVYMRDGKVRVYGYNMGGFLPGRETICAYNGGTGKFTGGYYQRWLLNKDGSYKDAEVARLYAQLEKLGVRGRLAYSIRSDGYVFMYLRIMSVDWDVEKLAA